MTVIDSWTEVVAACRESMRALVVADPTPADHPAKFPTSVLLELDHVITAEADRLGRRLRVIDPFAGTGRIHKLSEAAHFTVGIELEPEWAIHGLPGLTWVGDSTATPFPDSCADVIATSVVYPNRTTDHHEAKDPCNHTVKKAGGPVVYPLADCPKCKGSGLSPRSTYRHKLGRMPSHRSTAVMGWGCVAPGTRVLRGDWRWVPVESLRVGDPLIGFDEEIVSTEATVRQRGRRWRPSEVVATALGEEECVQVEFNDGTTVTCTTDHPWLSRVPHKKGGRRTRKWVKAENLNIGDVLDVFLPTWSEDRSYEAGWLAGMFDGEGSLGVRRSSTGETKFGSLALAQNPGPAMEQVQRLVRERYGCDFVISEDRECHRIVVRGGMADVVRLLGTIRPERLIPKILIDGISMRPCAERVVVNVRPLGRQPIVRLATSTSTYMAEGMGSHNSPYRRMHAAAIQEWVRLLGGGGLIVLNVSNHLVTVAKGEPQVEVRVVEWFCNEMMAQGCNIVEARRVATRRYRNGANSAARVDGEMILVMRTPPKVDGTLAAAPHAGGRRTENVAVGAVL